MADDRFPDAGVVHLDSEMLRTLAHPLRLRLLAALRVEGASTASALAARLGTVSGRTSYHLRKLAEVGLVVEDKTRGNARDRWWLAAHKNTSWHSVDFRDDPDDRAADSWLVNRQAQMHARWIADWVSSVDEWANEWLEATDISDYQIRLTPERLGELTAELREVVHKYLDRQESEGNAAAERVTVLLHAFPTPELAL